jgi:hypothetical protein
MRCNAFSQEAPTLPSATAFDPAYTAPVAETLLLSALNNGGVTNGTLAHVVRDLVTAAKRARAGEAVASALTLHVMQRLYVLLQNPPASPSGGEKSEATFIAAQRSEVMLLRLMLGPEVGLLRDRGELQSAFDALTLLLFSRRELHQSAATQSSRAAGQTGSATLTDLGVVATMELEVRAEVWKLLLDALDACTESPAAVAMCLQCGLGTVLVDLLQALLGVLDSHRRVKGSEDASVPSAVMLVSTTLLRAVARLLAYTAEVSATSASAASQQTLDALVWYVFTLGQVPLLVDGLRLRLQSWQEHGAAEAPRAESGRNGEHIATSVDFLIASAEYLGAVSDFLRYAFLFSRFGVSSVISFDLVYVQIKRHQRRDGRGQPAAAEPGAPPAQQGQTDGQHPAPRRGGICAAGPVSTGGRERLSVCWGECSRGGCEEGSREGTQ